MNSYINNLIKKTFANKNKIFRINKVFKINPIYLNQGKNICILLNKKVHNLVKI